MLYFNEIWYWIRLCWSQLFNSSRVSSAADNESGCKDTKLNLYRSPSVSARSNSFLVAPKKKPLGLFGKYFLVVFNSIKIMELRSILFNTRASVLRA